MQSSWSQSQPCSPLLCSRPRPTLNTYRLNQLTPKPKLVLPSKQEHLLTETSALSFPNQPHKEFKQHHHQHKLSIESPRRRRSLLEPLVVNSAKVIPIKTFEDLSNWRMALLCGTPEAPPLSNSGCLCPHPCHWKKEWTQRQGPKDLRAFRELLLQPLDEAVSSQIKKDIGRTFPESGSFGAEGTLGGGLQEMLRAYSVYDREVGYVQGLNLLGGVLLYHIHSPPQAFWALVDLMEDRQLRTLYLPGFPGLRGQQFNLLIELKEKLPEVQQVMQMLDIPPESFLDGWLLSMMGNCVPLQYMAAVVEGFRAGGWVFLRRLVLAYLLFLRERLLGSRDQAEFLELVSVRAGQEVGSQWQQVVDSVRSLSE